MMMSRPFIPACLTCAAVLRLVWLIAVPPTAIGDGEWYVQQGLRLAAGQGYTVTDDGFPLRTPGTPLQAARPTAFWPVGYPAFLAVLFSSSPRTVDPIWIAALANVVLAVATMAIVGWCAALFFGSPLTGRIALVLLAGAPNQIAYTSLATSEIWFTLLLAGGVALLVYAREHRRTVGWIAAGVVFGAATLTKPQIVLLPAVLTIALDWRRHRLPRSSIRRLLGIYLIVAVTLLPWIVRNYSAFHRFVAVSNNGGVNLLIGNTPGPWQSNGYRWTSDLKRIALTEHDEAERDRLAREAALRLIADHPGTVLAMMPKKLLSLYAFDVDGFGVNQHAHSGLGPPRVWQGLRSLSQLYYLAVVVAAAVATVRLRREGRVYPRVAVAVALYFAAVSMVFFGSPRFHYPVLPWLIVQASSAVAAHVTMNRTTGRPVSLSSAL
jgi:4-amino-4-deoxy-L-arabinose transferase-like glycosyltransferase